MPTDLLIQRCTLRLTRRGGWSWGSDPRSLARGAMSRLPAFVAERLAMAWPSAIGEERVTAPLRLRVPVRAEELRAWLAGSDDALDPNQALGQRIDEALRDLVGRAAGQVAADDDGDDGEEDTGLDASDARGDSRDGQMVANASPSVLLPLLLAWHRDDGLVEVLLSFSVESLQAWHDRLIGAAAGLASGAAETQADMALDALFAEADAWLLPLPDGARSRLVRRLLLIVEAHARCSVHPRESRFASRLAAVESLALDAGTGDRSAISTGQTPPVPGASMRGSSLPEGAAPARYAAGAGHSPARLPAAFELHAPSALPFLMLGPLAQSGFLRALAAVAESLALPGDALAAAATGLARKVLAPPLRGWHRTPEAIASARAFAGGAVVSDEVLTDLARTLDPHCGPLDAAIAQALTRGHTAGRPVILQRAGGWWLVDSDGLMPIAWGARVQALFPRLVALGPALVAVPQLAVEPGLLMALDAAAWPFVTDAGPARGEHWFSVSGSDPRAWRNDTQDGPARAAAASLSIWGDETAAVWQALGVERPALPVAASSALAPAPVRVPVPASASASAPALERSLTLAAAAALGQIAWTLWHRDGMTSPCLALRHLGDLDAQVVFRPDRVRVLLPLGRRFLHLKSAGLLDDVTGVPWLDGRPVQFGQG